MKKYLKIILVLAIAYCLYGLGSILVKSRQPNRAIDIEREIERNIKYLRDKNEETPRSTPWPEDYNKGKG